MSYHHPVEISANVAFLLRITSPHFPCRTALFLLILSILSIPDCSWGSLGSASHVKANELAPRQHKLLLVLSSQGYRTTTLSWFFSCLVCSHSGVGFAIRSTVAPRVRANGLERVTVPARHEVGRKRRRWSLQNVDTKLKIFLFVFFVEPRL
jgi:hypothetical protein